MDDTPKPKLILVGPYSLPHGGIQSYIRQLSALLREKGYVYNVLDTRSERDELYHSGLLRIVQRMFKYLSVLIKLIEIEGHIVHCFSSSYGNFYANGLIIVLAKFMGRKTAISMLGGGWPSVVENSGLIKTTVIKSIFSCADSIIACNEHIRESIISLTVSNKKISLISNALPIRVREREPLSSEMQRFFASHRPVIASVSALLPEYGAVTLIQALMQLRAKFHEIGLVLIVLPTTSSTIAREIHEILQKGDLSENVLIVKNVVSATAIIRKSDLFIRPNLLDGDSVSVREALLLGVPVVASDTAFRPKDVVLFKKGDVNDLSEKMKSVIENRQSFRPQHASEEARNNLQKIEAVYRLLSTPV